MRFDRLPEQIRTAIRTPTTNIQYVARADLTTRLQARDFGTVAPFRRWSGSGFGTVVRDVLTAPLFPSAFPIVLSDRLYLGRRRGFDEPLTRKSTRLNYSQHCDTRMQPLS